MKILVILGPTAVGKTKIAVECAENFNGEIISADSRQVFKGLDIGTGKDLKDYKNIKYHLINILEPNRYFSLKEFQYLAVNKIIEINNRNKLPIICGGTGLYIDSIVSRYEIPSVKPDYEYRNKLESLSTEEFKKILNKYKVEYSSYETRRRLIREVELKKYNKNSEIPDFTLPDISPIILGITTNREIQKSRIKERLLNRFENGMIDEVKTLIDNGVKKDWLLSIGLEYKWIVTYLNGVITYKDLFFELRRSIVSFSKRQNTWFRRMERKGIKINWFVNNETEKILEFIKIKLESNSKK